VTYSTRWACNERRAVGRQHGRPTLRASPFHQPTLTMQILHRRTRAILWNDSSKSTRIAVLRAVGAGASLECADLRKASLERANLRGARLRGANLAGSYMSGAILSGADLADVDLSEAYMSGAKLDGARLDGADVRRAYMVGCVMRGAYLRDVIWTGANLGTFDFANYQGPSEAWEHGRYVREIVEKEAKRSEDGSGVAAVIAHLRANPGSVNFKHPGVSLLRLEKEGRIVWRDGWYVVR
jgi:uncharacterized protein YjbI with pentapeptide repeats